MQQPLDARHLFFRWISSPIREQEIHLPIVNPSPQSVKHSFHDDEIYSFDHRQTRKSIESTKSFYRPPPIKDYFCASIFAFLTCFWMIGGIVCLFQSMKIRRLLRSDQPSQLMEARKYSNRLWTNLLYTYVIGGMTIGVFILTILVTFFVGIKGYFSRSL